MRRQEDGFPCQIAPLTIVKGDRHQDVELGGSSGVRLAGKS